MQYYHILNTIMHASRFIIIYTKIPKIKSLNPLLYRLYEELDLHPCGARVGSDVLTNIILWFTFYKKY